MTPPPNAPDLPVLHAALTRLPAFRDVASEALRPLPVKGVAHDHVRVAGRGVVLRVPRLSQFGLPAAENLRYQAACFERAGPSGRTPRLYAVIEPYPGLTFGALVVQDIEGRPPRLPGELGALAEALARVHALPVPPADRRPPLLSHDDAIGGTWAVIRDNARYIALAAPPDATRRHLEAELAWAEGYAADVRGRPTPLRLVVTDTHPGNFLVRADGRAYAVDLEKVLYGSPAIDLAHATLYTSTRWDPEVDARLGTGEVAGFYRAWIDASEPALVGAIRPWLVPARRLTWLRSTMFFLKWQVESARGGDWSAERLGPVLAAHIRAHVADCLDPETVAAIRGEWLGDAGRLEARIGA